MKNYFTLKHIKGDLFGGITAGIVALPLALAFGVSSGLGPAAGLYGAIFVSFFAALFGGTNTQISGPTAPMTAVSMVVIAGIVALNDGDVIQALPSILTVFFISGCNANRIGISRIRKVYQVHTLSCGKRIYDSNWGNHPHHSDHAIYRLLP